MISWDDISFHFTMDIMSFYGPRLYIDFPFLFQPANLHVFKALSVPPIGLRATPGVLGQMDAVLGLPPQT
jgi:hypothetical protein